MQTIKSANIAIEATSRILQKSEEAYAMGLLIALQVALSAPAFAEDYLAEYGGSPVSEASQIIIHGARGRGANMPEQQEGRDDARRLTAA